MASMCFLKRVPTQAVSTMQGGLRRLDYLPTRTKFNSETPREDGLLWQTFSNA